MSKKLSTEGFKETLKQKLLADRREAFESDEIVSQAQQILLQTNIHDYPARIPIPVYAKNNRGDIKYRTCAVLEDWLNCNGFSWNIDLSLGVYAVSSPV